MVALISEHPTAAQHHALLAMLPYHVQVAAARRDDILTRLDRADSEDDIIESFDTALIEDGGSHIGPFLASGDDNHQHEVSLLQTYGCGTTYPAAIASWRKAAQRMAVV